MTDMKQIPTSHICSMDESELKEFPVDKTLIADLFHGQGRIKTHHFWKMFYGGRRIRMRSQKYKQTKRRK